MESRDGYQEGKNIPLIMTLPEETMRNIFNYLSFETLYFSLRKVCKNIQTYVDHYLKVRGTTFLVGGQEDSKKHVIEIIKKPGKGFIIIRTPVSTISFVTNLQYNQSLDKYPCRRIDKVLHAAIGETDVCYMYKGNGLIYRYDLESDKWEKISENCRILRCLDHKQLSHECIQRLVSEDFPYYFEHDGFCHCNYPFVKAFYKPLNVSISKVMSCKRLKLK